MCYLTVYLFFSKWCICITCFSIFLYDRFNMHKVVNISLQSMIHHYSWINSWIRSDWIDWEQKGQKLAIRNIFSQAHTLKHIEHPCNCCQQHFIPTFPCENCSNGQLSWPQASVSAILSFLCSFVLSFIHSFSLLCGQYCCSYCMTFNYKSTNCRKPCLL